jgi:CubicO group peptidase (beta-lactamase class C family)
VVNATSALGAIVDEAASRSDFSGVVQVDRGDEVAFVRAYGLADRAHAIPNTPETRFGLASGTKGLTALTVLSLVDDGSLALDTTARSVLGSDIPMIDDRVTVEHLLAHRSGIGDYFDEDLVDDITDHVLAVPVHGLASSESYLTVLDGLPQVFPPGERFAYCNGGYVVLALIAERVSGTAFHDLVVRRVCEPAGMRDTEFLRTDELPGDVAFGYLSDDGLRTNVLHLPVRGNGDGGIYSTVADVASLWEALFGRRVVSEALVTEMVRPRSVAVDGSKRYGLGLWLHATSDVVWLEGYDAGVSFTSVHERARSTTATVISNTTEGAWPIARVLDEHLGTA